MVNIFSLQTKKKLPEIGMSTNSGVKIYNPNTQSDQGVYQSIIPGKSSTTVKPVNSNPLGVYGKNYYSGLSNSSPIKYSSSVTPTLDKINSTYPSVTSKTPTPPPSIDKPIPSAPTPQNSFDSEYTKYLDKAAGRNADLAKLRYDEGKTNAETLASNTEAGLKDDISTMNDYFNKYKTTQTDRADKLKENARTEQGAGQRKLAEGRRQQLSDTERRYAALGTIDSYGTGSFTESNTNTESDFSRLSAESQAALETKLSTIDSDAEDKISTEEQKVLQQARDITRLLANNTIAKNSALKDLYLTYQEKVAAIEDERDGLKLQAQQELLKSKQPELSSDFLKTGIPVTMNDYIFKQNNKDAFTGMGTNNSAQNEVKDTINLIDQVNGRDLTWNTGILGATPKIAGTNAYGTQKLIQQIKDKLALAARGQLKGQGQISDNETKMLANAVTALDSGLSAKDFADEMTKIRGILERNGGVTVANPIDSLATQYGL